MNTSRISTEEIERCKRICGVLRFVFKVGIPLGLTVMIVGALVASLYDPGHFRHRVPPMVNVISEVIMAVSCAALSLGFALDGYVSIRRHAKSALHASSGILVYAFASIILLSVAVGLFVVAYKHFTL
jgi:drug/metabolite transporter (DMT)-like permease